METKFLIIGGICVLAIIIVFFIINTSVFNYVDTSFATEIALKYHYGDKKIDVVITDENDINILKENLKGKIMLGTPSCGARLDISLTFTDGKRSITLCPACDSCWGAVIGDTNRYISIRDRDAFEAVVEKYGMTFPCV